MELLLNLTWITVAALLCGCCVRSHRSGKVLLPLGAALGCCVLLAVLLFPAISMTDDLQRGTALSDGRPGWTFGDEAQTFAMQMLAVAMFAAAVLLRRWRTLRGVVSGLPWRSFLLVPALLVRPPTHEAFAAA